MRKFKILLIIASLTANISFAQDFSEYLYRGWDLLYFADRGELDSVANILSEGVNVDFANEDGVTALMLASQAGFDDVVTFLIQNGADVNKKSAYYGISPLISAVRNDYLRTAEILIRNGANINEIDSWGRQAIHYAAMENYLATTDMLIYYDAEINDPDAFGITPLMYAVNNKHDSISYLLINYGADIYVYSNDGNSLMHLAAIAGNDSFIKKYHHLYINSPAYNRDSLTVLDLAIVNGNRDLVRFLIEEGYELRDTINNIYTPLTLAKASRSFKTRRYIRKLGYDDFHYPYFRRVGAGFDFIFNSTEFFVGINMNVTEDRYGWLGSVGFITRGNEKSVIIPKSDFELYQYWETRYGAYLKLQKHFRLFKWTNKSYTSIFAQLKPIYVWGSYKGIAESVPNEIFVSPGIGVSFNFGEVFRISINYEYTDMNIQSINPQQWNIGTKFLIPFRKNETEKKYQYIINY